MGLRTANPLDPQQHRWLLTIDSYDLDIQHRPGTTMSDADALSRPPQPDLLDSDGDEDYDSLDDEPSFLAAILDDIAGTIPDADTVKRYQLDDTDTNAIITAVKNGDAPSAFINRLPSSVRPSSRPPTKNLLTEAPPPPWPTSHATRSGPASRPTSPASLPRACLASAASHGVITPAHPWRPSPPTPWALLLPWTS